MSLYNHIASFPWQVLLFLLCLQQNLIISLLVFKSPPGVAKRKLHLTLIHGCMMLKFICTVLLPCLNAGQVS